MVPSSSHTDVDGDHHRDHRRDHDRTEDHVDVGDLLAERARLIADYTVGGLALCRQLAAVTDKWIAALAEAAESTTPKSAELGDYVLLAVGGYGRGDLAPYSDIDVLVVHSDDSPSRGSPSRGSSDESVTASTVEELVSKIWYPIWDAGLQLGHAVRTLDEQVAMIDADLHTATALLDARVVYGNQRLGESVIESARQRWADGGLLNDLREAVDARQRDTFDIAYALEPDLKNGHGGLRDVQSIWWGLEAGVSLGADDRHRLSASYADLVEVRVALHRMSGRPNEVLRLDQQDAVAELLATDADGLMAMIAASARQVAWLTDVAWAVPDDSLADPLPVSPHVWIRQGEAELDEDADIEHDPTLMLSVATAAAQHQTRIARETLERLHREMGEWPQRWPARALDKLVALLLEGHRAIPVIEALDQQELFTRMLPEWTPNRSRPQRNAYHRFTVDRHLWETAANAAELVHMVSRSDLLVLGALFHDIGKGYPGDHSEVGTQLVYEMAPRLGISDDDAEVVAAMVEHHLLLPDVAQRRDISDPATIEMVASRARSIDVLELLHALTIADSKATGPSAWSDWKAELVADLVDRVSHVVSGGSIADVLSTPFPDAATLELMAAGSSTVELLDGNRIVVVYVDLPGALYRIAGALSLHGLDVVTARVHSEQAQLGKLAMAAAEFRVEVPSLGVDWERVIPDVRRSLVAQLAIDARLAQRASTYQRRRRTIDAADPVAPSVRFDDSASSDATVIEVRAQTRIGILYAITRALSGTGCDVRHANVQTVGSAVYDTFYVRNWLDELITDQVHRDEIVRAVMFAIEG